MPFFQWKIGRVILFMSTLSAKPFSLFNNAKLVFKTVYFWLRLPNWLERIAFLKWSELLSPGKPVKSSTRTTFNFLHPRNLLEGIRISLAWFQYPLDKTKHWFSRGCNFSTCTVVYQISKISIGFGRYCCWSFETSLCFVLGFKLLSGLFKVIIIKCSVWICIERRKQGKGWDRSIRNDW